MMTRAMILGPVLMLGFSRTQAQLPDWTWAEAGGTTGDGVTTQVLPDPWGNVLVCGYFFDSANMGGTPLTAVGGRDAFVAKLDRNGTWLWATSFGSTFFDQANGLAVDADGSAYVTGSYEAAMNIGPFSLAITGTSDAFVAKIDSAGNWVWATSSTGSGSSWGADLALGPNGALYLGAQMDNNETFGTDTLTHNGFSAPVVARLDVNGNWYWAHALGTIDFADVGGIDYSAGEGVVVAGTFNGTLYAGNDTLVSGPTSKAYVAVVDTTGADQWAWKTSGVSASRANDVFVDQFGRMFVGGAAGIGQALIGDSIFTVNDGGDAFLVRVSPNGFWDWSRRSTGPGDEEIREIGQHPDGWIIVAGSYGYDTLHLENLVEANSGGYDAFVAGITPAGNWVLVRTAAGTGDDICNSVASDGIGRIYTGGSYSSSAGFGTDTLTTSAFRDAFVAQLSVIGLAVPQEEESSYAPVLLRGEGLFELTGVRDGRITVRVTDMVGRNIARRDGVAQGGRFALNGLTLSGAAYVVRVEQPGVAATLKCVLR